MITRADPIIQVVAIIALLFATPVLVACSERHALVCFEYFDKSDEGQTFIVKRGLLGNLKKLEKYDKCVSVEFGFYCELTTPNLYETFYLDTFKMRATLERDGDSGNRTIKYNACAFEAEQIG